MNEPSQQDELQRRWFNFARALVACTVIYASVITALGVGEAKFSDWVEYMQIAVPGWLAWDFGRAYLKRGAA